MAHNSRRVSYICFQTSYPSRDEWAVIVSGEILLYNSHLQKHKTRGLNIRPASDTTLRHSSYYAQGETNKVFRCPGRFEREVEWIPPIPQAIELHFSLTRPGSHLPSGRGQQWMQWWRWPSLWHIPLLATSPGLAKSPVKRGRESQSDTLVPSNQGHTKWWRSQAVSQQGGTGHLPFLIRKSTGIFSPPTVCTPLAKIFRRLFKWELKVWLFNKDEKLMHFQCVQAGSIQIILLCNLHP